MRCFPCFPSSQGLQRKASSILDWQSTDPVASPNSQNLTLMPWNRELQQLRLSTWEHRRPVYSFKSIVAQMLSFVSICPTRLGVCPYTSTGNCMCACPAMPASWPGAWGEKGYITKQTVHHELHQTMPSDMRQSATERTSSGAFPRCVSRTSHSNVNFSFGCLNDSHRYNSLTIKR